jgi:molecular chaperone GrpE
MAKKKEKIKDEEKEKPEEEIEPSESTEDAGEPEVMVAYTIEEVDAMKDELAAARDEAEKNLDSYHRALADYNNLKRRTEIEREQMKGEAIGKVLAPFLEIIDDLEIAIQSRPEDSTDNGWGDGIELVYRKLRNKLDSHGVKMMEPLGQPFDPRFHEAIGTEPSDEFESGDVILVIRPGYILGERVLRTALVKVAA